MSARKTWQDFKKKNPEFAKNKKFKADLGPNLDLLNKIHVSWFKAEEKQDAASAAWSKALTSVEAIIGAYEQIAKDMGPKVAGDFDKVKQHILMMHNMSRQMIDLRKQYIKVMNDMLNQV